MKDTDRVPKDVMKKLTAWMEEERAKVEDKALAALMEAGTIDKLMKNKEG